LVTGGAGFIGSHLVDRLILAGNKVVVVDNFETGFMENLARHVGSDFLDVVKQDVEFPLDFEVDEIYNLACPASPVKYQSDAIRTIKTIVFGALNVLELAKRLNIKVLQASTSEVYGDALIHPQPENYWGNVNPIGIRSCYDEAKRLAETIFVEHFRQHDVQIKIARIFNTYGPRMSESDGRVVSNFAFQALRGQDLTVYGDGMQTRSFCHVTDLVDGLILLMESESPFDGPINLGNPTEYSVNQIAEAIIELSGSQSQITFRDLPEDDPKQRKPDITKAQNLLGWSPKIGLNEGLIDTLQQAKKIGQTG